MMDQIKAYANIIAAVIALCGLGFTHFKAYEYGEDHIQKKMDKMEANLHEQKQQAKDDKIRIEAEQHARYDTAQTGYNGALSVLNDRLRTAETVPGCGGVQMASGGSGNGPVPGETSDTAGAYIRLATYQGTCLKAFYDDAMKQTLQCQGLIKIVK